MKTIALALAAGSLTFGTPAAGTTVSSVCTYPYVCFYSGDSKTGEFKDVATGWQVLTNSRGADYVINTRHDDGALLHFTNGGTRCVRPNTDISLRPIGVVDKLRISNSPSC